MEILTKRYDGVGETLHSAVLPNGLRVRVIPKKGFSSCFACFGTYYGSLMRSFLLAGERRDTPAGVAHYLEHKMFDMPEGDNALQSMTAAGAECTGYPIWCCSGPNSDQAISRPTMRKIQCGEIVGEKLEF